MSDTDKVFCKFHEIDEIDAEHCDGKLQEHFSQFFTKAVLPSNPSIDDILLEIHVISFLLLNIKSRLSNQIEELYPFLGTLSQDMEALSSYIEEYSVGAMSEDRAI